MKKEINDYFKMFSNDEKDDVLNFTIFLSLKRQTEHNQEPVLTAQEKNL